MVRILYLILGLNIGGTENQLVELLRGLDTRKYEWRVISFKGETRDLNPAINLLDNQRLKEINIEESSRFFQKYYKILLYVKSFCKTENIDIIHSFFFNENIINVITKALYPKVSSIISIRNLLPNFSAAQTLLAKFFYYKADLLLANSNAVRNRVQLLIAPFRKHVEVVYNGIDSQKFSLADEKQRFEAKKNLGFQADDFVVGMVANMRAEKDHQCLLKALLIAKEKCDHIKAAIVGYGPLKDIHAQFCLKHNMDFVRFTGKIEDVESVLPAFDVGVLISFSEGFSNVILEYMCCGVPVIATKVGGNAEAVVHDETGYIINVGDFLELSKHIVYLYRHPGKLKEMGFKGRQRVEKYFSATIMAQRYMEAYDHIIQSKQ